MAAAVNSLFQPPGIFSTDAQAWYVNCTAIPPDFAVVIGGRSFPINPADMILPAADSAVAGLCPSAITDGDVPGLEGLYNMGTPFLKNVVAVFDVGATEMRFARHSY